MVWLQRQALSKEVDPKGSNRYNGCSVSGIRFKSSARGGSGVSVQVSGNKRLKSENNENIRPFSPPNNKGLILATVGLTPDTRNLKPIALAEDNLCNE